MATKKDLLKGGISAMFGDSGGSQPPAVEISDEQYEELEERQIERRHFLTGRRRKGDNRELETADDVRTTIVMKKSQYDIIREIALRESMTIKEIITMMFSLAIERYEKKNGKVEVRRSKSRRDLF